MNTSAPNSGPHGSAIFIHVPKAAGSTLQAILEKQYPAEAICRLRGSVEELQAFQSLPEGERKKIRLLSGHCPFGQHVFLASPCRYITILREPVEMAVSFYYYVLREPNHYLHREVVSNNISLKEFVESGMCPGVLNHQTYLIAGIPHPQKEWDDPDYPLTVAIENLKGRFSVAGLSERFPETLLLIKRALGWKSIPRFANLNVTKGRPARAEIPAETRAVIEKHNQWDIQLYNLACARFNQAVQQAGNSFKRELAKQKALDLAYSVARAAKRSLAPGKK